MSRRAAVSAKPRAWTLVKAVDSDAKRASTAPPAQAPVAHPVGETTFTAPPTAVPSTTAFAQDADSLIRSVYDRMFGQAYLFAADRASLVPVESAFRCGALTVKDLVRAVAKSPAYMARFFHQQTTYANVEVMVGHLLGRRPNGVDEYRQWARVYDASGYAAMVNAMMDDGEYDAAFGDGTVPHTRAHGLSVTGADAYRRAVTPAGIRLGDEGVGEDDGGAAAGLAVVAILAALAIGGYLLSTGATN